MSELLSQLVTFDDKLLRNTVATLLTNREFDDLSDAPIDWEYAEKLATANIAISKDKLHYHAIDYIFNCKQWFPSRFLR